MYSVREVELKKEGEVGQGVYIGEREREWNRGREGQKKGRSEGQR